MGSLHNVAVYLLVALCCFVTFINGLNSRERFLMNFDWLFHLGSQDLDHMSCTSSSFSMTKNKGCQGLTLMKSVSKNDPNECANACCANPTCSFFQISDLGECYIGNVISIYIAFNWKTACTDYLDGFTFYSRSNIPDTNPNHFIAASKSYDDSKWNQITLPHDYVVYGNVTFNINEEKHGYLPKNCSWYRKHFSLPSSYMNDTTLWIDFDGIFRDSVVFINGDFLGNHSSGYTSFRYYLDNMMDKLEFGDNSDNVLSVFVDATADEGWWYEGGGIYRNVWFNKANKIYFEPWGIYLPTTNVTVNNDGIHGNGNLIINATINNKYNIDYYVNIKLDIVKPNGVLLKTLTMNDITIKSTESITVTTSYYAENIELWDIGNPSLYKVNCTIYDTQNEEMDFISLRYGYRKVVFDVNNGLFLNDKRIKMKGFCNHQDFGGTGIATPERINRFRIEHLKNMGANSWRMSHNPPNPELLDFADEYGFLIWDENRHFGNSPQWFDDQRDMILRDRNHPSIIIWSICNEAGCMEEKHGDHNDVGNITILFKHIIQKYDGIYNNNASDNQWGYNRPISAAMDKNWGDPMSPDLDIQGVNYNYPELSDYHKQHPNQLIISSESCSCTQDRNEYVSSAIDGHCSAYMGCPWNNDPCPQGCWIPIATQDFVIGSFDWTGFDYKGEPKPYAWPDINSHFGVNDIVGFPKDMYFYFKSVWIDMNDEIILHILPNTWNNDTMTNPVQVRIYTNCEYVELFLNNKSLNNGKPQKVVQYEYFGMNVTWQYGELKVNCYDDDSKILSYKSVQTTNAPYAIKLEWEYPYSNNQTIIGDGQDVALISVYVMDDNNRIVPNSTNLITFSVDDETIAFILGVGNGDPSSHQRDKSNLRSVYHGKARILIQSMLNKYGTVTLTAKSDGLISGEIQINVQSPNDNIITI